ncbi:MAG: FAD-dependent oxidoreductase, partial [Vicinamibacterales bacterium]
MATDADILVIGAGIIGCAVARELTARGARTHVLDARRVGQGATQASAGMLAPYTEAHDSGPLLGLLVRSLDLYDEWIQAVREESRVAVEYRRDGSLEAAFDAEGAETLRQIGTAAGADRCQWLDAIEARALEPGLTSRVLGGLFAPGHGFVSAPDLTDALSRAVVRGGGLVQTGARA